MRRWLLACSFVACLALLALPAAAQGLGSPWWSVDGGGTYAGSGEIIIGATVGQPDAGTVSGGWYTLHGGYWPGATVRHAVIYVPIISGNWVKIIQKFTYGQLSIVAAALVLAAVWLRRGRRAVAA